VNSQKRSKAAQQLRCFDEARMKADNSPGRFEASVNIFVDPIQKAQVIDALSKLENIDEIYDVKGEFDIVSIVSASSIEEFRNVLHKKIMNIKGVKSTIISIVLKAHKRPKSALNSVHLS
jgi:DNA-binding Lrp family transcriptional regulator